MTTILIVAGETSGDLHGGNLARALRALDPGVRLIGTGGRYMREAGVELIHDTTAHATVGIFEVLAHFGRYAALYRKLQSVLKREKPDVAVLIDSPDFNLPFAARVADHGIPVAYYIGPQLWAWRKGRIKTVRKVVRKMLVILPFEERFYRDAGVDVAFVGHPLLDAERPVDRAAFRREFGSPEILVGLLPGSRRKQFRWLFPRMRAAAELIRKERPGAKFVAGLAPAIDPAFAAAPGIDTVVDRTPELMASADVLLVASGTATLEAAMYGTPMVMTYQVHPLTACVVKPILWKNPQDLALPNIVAGKRVVPELYMGKGTPENLAREALSLLEAGRAAEVRRELAEVRRRMGAPGASRRAAEEVLRVAAGQP